MADRPPDEAFAQHLLKGGFATDAQVKDALREQAERALKGASAPLSQILVEQGVITAAQRENIEKKLDSQREEAKRLGPYRVVRKLGEGGMGAVYLAEDASTGEKVALKVLPKIASKEQDAVRRFLREVESARKLEHPNIVRAGAAGEDKGFHYYVMEYVAGETLGARIKREEAFPPDEAAKMVLQVAYGLKYAHEQGYIHRDIKPENVIVTPEGVAKILDMGLSKNIDEAQTFRTVTGVTLGTPHYMAPEQARGDKGIDGRADIYSLGATYYHMVTGETPFHGTTAIELISQHLKKQLPDPRDIRDGIPDGVVHVIRRMMAKRPDDRYRDCQELITDLELVLGGRNPSSQALEAARSAVGLPMDREARERYRAQRRGQRPGTVRATTKPRTNRVPLMVGGICMAVALVILLVVSLGGGSKPPATGPVVTKADPLPPPKPRIPEPAPLPPKTLAELREDEAREKLEKLQAVEKRGQFAPDEIRRRYGEFAKEYVDTPQGRTIAEGLKSTEPKVEEPKVVEAPKPPKPPPPAPPEPKPEPVVKPPEPAPKPPPTPAPARQDARKPVPDAAKLKEGEAALRKAFKIDGARSPAEKAALARELLQTASTSGAKDAELYVMLSNARDLSAQAADAKTALEAIDAMAAAFEVNAIEEKAHILTKTQVRGPDAAAWARICLEVSDQAEEAGDYDSAAKLASRAEALAGAARDATLLSAAKERSKELQELKREADRLKTHFKTLETNADDPAANSAVGKFLCLVKEDWGKGLPMLAKGSDENLKPNFNSLKSFPATRHSGNRPKWPIGAGFRLGLSPNLVQTI
jgi:serine/threonine-protein kinase